MSTASPTAPITINVEQEAINAWQIQKIKDGLNAVAEGRVKTADKVREHFLKKTVISSVNTKPKYILADLLAKCDENAPTISELKKWDSMGKVGSEF